LSSDPVAAVTLLSGPVAAAWGAVTGAAEAGAEWVAVTGAAVEGAEAAGAAEAEWVAAEGVEWAAVETGVEWGGSPVTFAKTIEAAGQEPGGFLCKSVPREVRLKRRPRCTWVAEAGLRTSAPWDVDRPTVRQGLEADIARAVLHARFESKADIAIADSNVSF